VPFKKCRKRKGHRMSEESKPCEENPVHSPKPLQGSAEKGMKVGLFCPRHENRTDYKKSQPEIRSLRQGHQGGGKSTVAQEPPATWCKSKQCQKSKAYTKDRPMGRHGGIR